MAIVGLNASAFTSSVQDSMKIVLSELLHISAFDIYFFGISRRLIGAQQSALEIGIGVFTEDAAQSMSLQATASHAAFTAAFDSGMQAEIGQTLGLLEEMFGKAIITVLNHINR